MNQISVTMRWAASIQSSSGATSAIRTKPLPGLPYSVSRAKNRPGKTCMAAFSQSKRVKAKSSPSGTGSHK